MCDASRNHGYLFVFVSINIKILFYSKIVLEKRSKRKKTGALKRLKLNKF